MSQAFNARATEEGRTFISKRGGGSHLGEKMFPEFITLRSPIRLMVVCLPRHGRAEKAGLAEVAVGLGVGGGADPVPVQRVNWIEKGVVKNLGLRSLLGRKRRVTRRFHSPTR